MESDIAAPTAPAIANEIKRQLRDAKKAERAAANEIKRQLVAGKEAAIAAMEAELLASGGELPEKPTERAVTNELKRQLQAQKKAESTATAELSGELPVLMSSGNEAIGVLSRAKVAADPGGKALVNVSNRHLDEMIADAWKAEIDRLIEEASLYVREGDLVRLVRRRHGGLAIACVSQHAMLNRLVEVARWVKLTPKTQSLVGQVPEIEWVEKPASPPDKIPGMMLAAPHPRLPELDAVVTTPVFGANGDLIARPGYHRDDRLWFDRAGLAIEGVPLIPTRADLEAAKALIDEMLVDFMFQSPSGRTHAVGLLVLPFVRRMIKGPTPLHLIDASAPGAGKSLLASVTSLVALGRQVEAATIGRDEDETRKKITTALMRGSPIVLLDNIREGIDSASLAAVLTAEVWSDRVLGGNTDCSAPNLATWIATANNPKVTTEIARRVSPIRLAVDSEKPHERTGFRHPRLLEWVASRRADIVRAVLILVRHWQAEGAKPGLGTMGSFEAWVSVIGGILANAGYPDFLMGARELFDHADVEGAEWREFVAAWHAAHADKPLSADPLLHTALAGQLLGSVVRGDATERSQKSSIGKALGKMRGRVFDLAGEKTTTVRIDIGNDKHTKAKSYRLVTLAGE